MAMELYPGPSRPIFRIAVVAALAAVAAGIASAQEERRTVTAATRDYDVAGFNRWLLGEDYRALWTRPIEVPLLDIDREGGGLTPLRRVGGAQTPGLALTGADGRAYTFRSVDKDPASTLPDSWYYTIPADVVQDQTAADHPAAAVIVAQLADAAGLLHTWPRLVVMPNSPQLGQFEAAFAGRLGTIEQYPTARSDSYEGFHGATEIISTARLWERARAGDGKPDAQALLRARLFDMVIGDRDRHRGQWRWARIPDTEGWQPIPEDRDHAFVSYEGFALAIARTHFPELVRFGDRIDQLDGLNASGLEVDGWILSELRRDDFRRAAESLVAALTDDAIETAVRAMPVEYQPLSAEPLARRLRHRRDDLVRAAGEFYEDLARQVDVHASDGADAVRIDHSDAGARVRIENAAGEATFERQFENAETDRVRLYLHGGGDTVTVTGRSDVEIAVVAGSGSDSITALEGGASVFDVGDDDTVVGRSGVSIDRRQWVNPRPVENAPWLGPRDRGVQQRPHLWSSLEPDSSVFLGAGMSWTGYGFRASPFAWRHRVQGGFSFGRQEPRLEYVGTFRRRQSTSFWGVHARANSFARLNFYGFGNETVRDEARGDRFYHANTDEIAAGGTYNVETGDGAYWSAGVTMSHFGRADDERELLAIEQPYGSTDFWQGELHTTWRIDTRRRANSSGVADWRLRDYTSGDPYQGINARVRARLQPPILDVEDWFGSIEGFVTRYRPVARRLTLATRAGGRHVWGRFPWHSAAFLGGATSVRGLHPQRYAGRSSLYGNLELRYTLARAVLIVPGELGVFSLADIGRVWADDDVSSKWHSSYGGGLFFLVPEVDFGVHAVVAGSNDGTRFYVGSGFGF